MTDFGSANLEKRSKTSGEGAIIYSAPEMFPPADHHVKQTVKVDSFSYGILLCEVIDRKMPDPDNFCATLQAVETQWKSIHGLAMSCTEPDPLNRLNMAEVIKFLQKERVMQVFFAKAV